VNLDWLSLAETSVQTLPPVAVIVTTPASILAVVDHVAVLPGGR
jgi:hypothetical protein